MTLPPIPKDRNWSPETWRAGLDEAVRLCGWSITKNWNDFKEGRNPIDVEWVAIIAHATTLLDADIVKPVVSEAEEVLKAARKEWRNETEYYEWDDSPAAIAVIQSALDKARAGE